MGPREIIMEHIRFWTSPECPPLSIDEIDFIRKIGETLGVKIGVRSQLMVLSDAPSEGA